MQRVADGEEGVTSGATGNDEVAHLGRAFDKMAGRIEEDRRMLERSAVGLSKLLQVLLEQRGSSAETIAQLLEFGCANFGTRQAAVIEKRGEGVETSHAHGTEVEHVAEALPDVAHLRDLLAHDGARTRFVGEDEAAGPDSESGQHDRGRHLQFIGAGFALPDGGRAACCFFDVEP